MRAAPDSQTRAVLLSLLDEAFDRRSWHGTNLRGSIRGMTTETAAYRPRPDRHNAWEIVLHAAYWKYVIRRRLTHQKRGGFRLAGSNWWTRPGEAGARGWRGDVAILIDEHRALRAEVAAFPVDQLGRTPAGSPFTYAALIRGAAAHDLYHAGQIQLLKRLADTAR